MTQVKDLTINFLSDPHRKGVTPKLKRLLKRAGLALQFTWMVYHPLVTELPVELFLLGKQVTKTTLAVGSSIAVASSVAGYGALLLGRDVPVGITLGGGGYAAALIKRRLNNDSNSH